MFIFSILFLIVLILFALMNLGALGALIFGLLALLASKIKRRSEFWPALLASMCSGAGLGALLGSWGVSSLVSHLTPNWGWAVLAWICGFPVGALLGGIFVAIAIVQVRHRNLKSICQETKAFWRDARHKFSSPLRFSQVIEIGKWSWQCAFSLDRKNADEERLKPIPSA